MDWVEINYDETFKKESKSGAIGVIARDSEGRAIDGLGKEFLIDNAFMAKAYVVKEGLKFVVNNGWMNVVIEIDVKGVIDEFQKFEKLESYFCLL
ncbi:hypothetical protein GOBAR_DD25647 [Gossypium barbadense]|nr:hypothetical protein GOBAR_DD25647 [Gossypium barbadense]